MKNEKCCTEQQSGRRLITNSGQDLDRRSSSQIRRPISGEHPLAGDGLSFERSPPFKPSSPEDSSRLSIRTLKTVDSDETTARTTIIYSS